MPGDGHEESVRRLLGQMDRQQEIEEAQSRQIINRQLEFLARFHETKARVILPALEFYRNVDSNSFKVTSDDKSATLSVTRAGVKGRVTFRAIADRAQVELSGVPHRESSGLSQSSSTSYAPLFIPLEMVTEQSVKNAIDALLEEMARSR